MHRLILTFTSLVDDNLVRLAEQLASPHQRIPSFSFKRALAITSNACTVRYGIASPPLRIYIYITLSTANELAISFFYDAIHSYYQQSLILSYKETCSIGWMIVCRIIKKKLWRRDAISYPYGLVAAWAVCLVHRRFIASTSSLFIHPS